MRNHQAQGGLTQCSGHQMGKKLKREDIGKDVADSVSTMPETDSSVKQLYSNKI